MSHSVTPRAHSNDHRHRPGLQGLNAPGLDRENLPVLLPARPAGPEVDPPHRRASAGPRGAAHGPVRLSADELTWLGHLGPRQSKADAAGEEEGAADRRHRLCRRPVPPLLG